VTEVLRECTAALVQYFSRTSIASETLALDDFSDHEVVSVS